MQYTYPVLSTEQGDKIINVTGFAKRGLPHTSNLPTLTIHNFRLKTAIALKFEHQ